MSRDHRKLDAFVLADEMALGIYRETRDFPRPEIYGLRSQLRRAAVSVPTNIVEGCARESEKDLLRFLDIAFASSRELNYLISLCGRLELMEVKRSEDLVLFGGRISAAIAALRKSYA
jgi:four helix bundle protein